MVRLHELSLGDTFEDLLVEVWQLEGVDPASKPRDPVYSALVRDPSGYCRLIYRANNNCKPSAVKRGKFYRISGKVSSCRGRLQVQVGSSWGRVEKVNGDEFECDMPYSPATDLSGIERWYGALVVHAAPDGDDSSKHRLRAFILPTTSNQQQQQKKKGNNKANAFVADVGEGVAALLPTPLAPVPCTTAGYVETERSAAMRALRDVLRATEDSVRLLPLAPVLHVQAGGAEEGGAAPAVWHIFTAVLQVPDDDLSSVFGEPRGGTWVELDKLDMTTESAAWKPPLAQAVSMIRTAHGAGLLDLPAGTLPPLPPVQSVAAVEPAETSGAAAAAKGAEAPAPPADKATAGKGAGAEARLLPVTLLSGFLGAGKTTLLRHILTHREPNLRVAVVVNDMAELNIDAALVAHGSIKAAAANANANAASKGTAAATAASSAAPERLIEMHNGCICCTLRTDLVTQIAEIAADGRFDYCVVESTGIGEPMQVAETFEFPLDGSDPAALLALEAAAAKTTTTASPPPAAAAAASPAPRRLADVARLDTCVTVVDAANLMANLNSLETLKERHQAEQTPTPAMAMENGEVVEEEVGEEEELERNVADLLLDQLEFADVILLNKVEIVPSSQLPRLLALVSAINPSAHVLPTSQCRVPLSEVLNTGRFSLERAREGAGWLKAMREGTELVPETAEYGITSFVWRSRRPFHPARLHAFMDTHFVLQQPDGVEGDSDAQKGDTSRMGSAAAAPSASVQVDIAAAAAAAQQAASVLSTAFRGADSSGFTLTSALQAAAGAAAAAATSAATAAAAAAAAAASAAAAVAAASNCGGMVASSAPGGEVAAAKGAARSAAFGDVLRSKGFTWVAGRGDHMGEWSSAGNLLRFGTAGPWFDVLPRELWPTDPDQVAEIQKDFMPDTGDRRQELVFIGIDMRRRELEAALEACLATDKEVQQLRAASTAAAAGASGAQSALDPFLPWPDAMEIMDSSEEEEEEEDEEEDGEGEEEETEGEEEEDLEREAVRKEVKKQVAKKEEAKTPARQRSSPHSSSVSLTGLTAVERKGKQQAKLEGKQLAPESKSFSRTNLGELENESDSEGGCGDEDVKDGGGSRGTEGHAGKDRIERRRRDCQEDSDREVKKQKKDKERKKEK